MVEKERIPFFLVFIQDGEFKIEVGDDTHIYELYGFLKCYIKIIEEELVDNFRE